MSPFMHAFLLGVSVVIGLLIVPGLWRVARGPRVFDRILAASLVAINGLLLLVLAGFLFERVDMFVDLALAFALLGFLVPLAAGRIVGREGTR